MGTRRRILLLVSVLALLGLPERNARSEDDDLRARWKTMRAEVLERLHGLADRSARKKLFAVRADLYVHILTLAPDDPVARRRLKYTLDENGEWIRKARWRRPRNLSKGAADIKDARRALGIELAPRLSELIEESRTEGLQRETGAAIVAALAIDPESETFREWNGEVRDGQAGRPGQPTTWILRETERARKRRPLLAETARKAVEDMPTPEDGKPTRNDGLGNVEWTARLQGERVRVVGTPPRTELELTLRYTEAAWPLFHAAFGRLPKDFQSGDRYAVGLTVYSMDDIEMANAFLAEWPGQTARDLEFLAPLVGTWIRGHPAVLCKSPGETTRLEVATSQVLGAMNYKVLGLRGKRGWAAEGLSLYLTWQITGTRTIYSVRDVKSRYGEGERPIPEYEKSLSNPNADWLALGLDLIRSPDKPDLNLLVGKDLNDLTKVDALYAYCLCAYVLEGHPEESLAFFRRVAAQKGTDIGAVSIEVLGFGQRTLETRLARWLAETTGG